MAGRPPKPANTRFAEILKRRGLTYASAAGELGISPQHVSYICRGGEPSPKVAERIIGWAKGAVTIEDLYAKRLAPAPAAESAA